MARARHELTVRLARDGDALHAVYHRPTYGPIAERRAPWTPGADVLRVAGAAGLDALGALLDRGHAAELVEHLTEGDLSRVGGLLFEALLGEREHWEPVLRGVFELGPAGRPNPIYGPVRLRVCADDGLLGGLPWRLTTWRGQLLCDHGWTFEATALPEPSRHVDLPTPAKVLVLAPACAGAEDLETDTHLAALREALLRVSPHYASAAFLRVEQTRDGLLRGLRGMHPHVLYYYGHADVRGDQACLLLGGRDDRPDPLRMGDLRRILAANPPLVACLNGCKTAASGWHAAGHQLGTDVPLVLSNRTTAWSAHAGTAAIQWLARTLGEGEDPVVALCRLPANACTRGFQWATMVAHTHYRSWSAGRDPTAVRPPVVGLRLDRDQQRALLFKHVSDLVQSRARRVEAAVAFAAPGNHVERFYAQLIDYLEIVATHLAHVKRVVVRFPEDRDDLERRLEDELRVQLDVQPHETLEQALRFHAPRPDPGGAAPLLWFDWGTFGGELQPSLTPEQLTAWVGFCADTLTRHCPAEVRVVSYLAMEVDARHHGRLTRAMDALREQFFREAFRCSLIPALPDLKLIDLMEFLGDPTNTTCPAAIAGEVARLMFEETRGHYAETIALIEEAEQTTWTRLLGRLRSLHQPTPTPEDGDEPF